MLSVRNLTFAWRSAHLFEDINLLIERGDRIGLLGRNGTGKSTLLNLLASEIEPDHGEIVLSPGLKVARLVQDVPNDQAGAVADIMRGSYRAEQADADHADWAMEKAVDRVLSRMELDGDAEFSTLSSGMKRRVLLAESLVSDPDVLLLDEPTNHLDIESIAWLEKFLLGFTGALVFVTHDRVFLQALANRIVEIDRGRLFEWRCDYGTFLKRKQAALDAEDKQNVEFDRKLAIEEKWIRQGIKARRTRNEGRVRALEKMRLEFRERRRDIGNVRMKAVDAGRSGQRVIEAEKVSFGYDETPIICDFSALITRGEKIGLIGSNGAGKTTLLKLLLGELTPTSGEISRGVHLKTIYFDQLREQLDEESTVAENVGEGQEMMLIDGKRKHILGYLQEFLFTPERARQPVKFLSGGERNRLLLARLFKRSSNLLVLDEPTNDLDTETLELLEELVVNYSGTVLLVSHDRAFLNNVVTSTLALLGDGCVGSFDGGYDDFVRQREASSESQEEKPAKSKQAEKKPVATSASKPAKLSFKERRELDSLPTEIETREVELAELHEDMASPEFFKRGPQEIAAATNRQGVLQSELNSLFARWEELESRA
jgi:ABC transport system ATP-binding/permease protein